MDTRAERNDQYSSIELEALSVLDDPEEPDESRGNYMAALAWLKKEYNVVPQKAVDKKHPGVKWAHLQNQRVTKDELFDWYPMFANGVGFITGAISGIIVIESDGPEGEALLAEFEKLHGPLPETLVIRSGSGRGLHRHFKHPGHRVKTMANTSIKLDIKGDGGFCVLPPSRHKSGGLYNFVHNAEAAELPQGLLEFIAAAAARVKGKRLPPHIGRRRASRDVSGAAARLETNLYARPPINRTNVALIQSMLDALPDEYASEYGLWLRTGFALHDFNDGEVGLALWRKFSRRCAEKADGADFEGFWVNFSRDYHGRKISLGWLRAEAEAHGWRAPCRWDRSTEIELERIER